MLDPDVVLLDEPVSALAPSSAAQVLDLLAHPGSARRPGYALVSHEAEVIRALTDRVVVLYAGRVAEPPPITLAGGHVVRCFHPVEHRTPEGATP